MLIEYDGLPFSGWQIQPEHPSVQASIEDALEVVLKQRPEVVGSGRTDAGVHARGQVAHFDADSAVDTVRLRRSLNGLLPGAVAVVALEETSDEFHARYDARSRRYRYYVTGVPTALDRQRRWLLRPVPDFDRMNAAAESLIGKHDFDSFCIAKSETKNRVCTIYSAMWVREETPTGRSDWYFEIEGDRFLHGMVRAIVGTIVDVGRGKRAVSDIEGILAEKDRRAAGPAAPAHGLVLERVSYDDWFAAHAFDVVSARGTDK